MLIGILSLSRVHPVMVKFSFVMEFYVFYIKTIFVQLLWITINSNKLCKIYIVVL